MWILSRIRLVVNASALFYIQSVDDEPYSCSFNAPTEYRLITSSMKLNTGMSSISQKVFDLLNMQYYAHIVLKLCVLFCLSAAIARAEDGIIALDDGTLYPAWRRCGDAKGSPPGDALLWSVAAHKPQLPLLFTNSEGEKSLFYFTPLSEHYGEYHALRVADGRKQWMQPVWSHTSGDLPVSPVFFNSAIYLGHWLMAGTDES